AGAIPCTNRTAGWSWWGSCLAKRRQVRSIRTLVRRCCLLRSGIWAVWTSPPRTEIPGEHPALADLRRLPRDRGLDRHAPLAEAVSQPRGRTRRVRPSEPVAPPDPAGQRRPLQHRALREGRFPVTSPRQHEWGTPFIRNYVPVIPCRNCRVVWWPDRNEPRSECKPKGGGQ